MSPVATILLLVTEPHLTVAAVLHLLLHHLVHALALAHRVLSQASEIKLDSIKYVVTIVHMNSVITSGITDQQSLYPNTNKTNSNISR